MEQRGCFLCCGPLLFLGLCVCSLLLPSVLLRLPLCWLPPSTPIPPGPGHGRLWLFSFRTLKNLASRLTSRGPLLYNHLCLEREEPAGCLLQRTKETEVDSERRKQGLWSDSLRTHRLCTYISPTHHSLPLTAFLNHGLTSASWKSWGSCAWSWRPSHAWCWRSSHTWSWWPSHAWCWRPSHFDRPLSQSFYIFPPSL